MAEINYTYQHEDFNPSWAYDYTLLVQVNSSDFTCAVVYNDKLMALAEHCNIEELANSNGMAGLLGNFKDIVIGIDAEAFTLVPVQLFAKDRVVDFARFLDVQPDERILAQQLDEDNFIVYKTTRIVIDAIMKFDFSNCVHSGKGWVNSMAGSNPADSTIYVNIEDASVEFLNFSNGKIRFYNTFEYKTTDDLAYFTSLVFGETQHDQDNVQLILSGPGAQNAEYRARLSDFFLIVKSNTFKIAEMPEELNSGKLLKLSALLLCVSSEAR